MFILSVCCETFISESVAFVRSSVSLLDIISFGVTILIQIESGRGIILIVLSAAVCV